jgi:predicted transcriptional regulator
VKKTKRSLDLNVNRTTAAVVQDAARTRLLDIAAQADAEEGIRQGREDVANGRVSPANEALKSVRREHGISS